MWGAAGTSLVQITGIYCRLILSRGVSCRDVATLARKVDVRIPEKGDANSHGARPVY